MIQGNTNLDRVAIDMDSMHDEQETSITQNRSVLAALTNWRLILGITLAGLICMSLFYAGNVSKRQQRRLCGNCARWENSWMKPNGPPVTPQDTWDNMKSTKAIKILGFLLIAAIIFVSILVVAKKTDFYANPSECCCSAPLIIGLALCIVVVFMVQLYVGLVWNGKRGVATSCCCTLMDMEGETYEKSFATLGATGAVVGLVAGSWALHEHMTVPTPTFDETQWETILAAESHEEIKKVLNDAEIYLDGADFAADGGQSGKLRISEHFKLTGEEEHRLTSYLTKHEGDDKWGLIKWETGDQKGTIILATAVALAALALIGSIVSIILCCRDKKLTGSTTGGEVRELA